MLLVVFLVSLLGVSLADDASDMQVQFKFYRGQVQGSPFLTYNLTTAGTCDLGNSINWTQYNVLFYVHGYESSLNSKEIACITQMSTFMTNYIIIEVSYKYQDEATSAPGDVPKVGGLVGGFMVCLNSTYGVPLDNITCAGHSLGAHMCGIGGRTVINQTGGLKIGQIAALDPSNIATLLLNIAYQLQANDSAYTQVFHTSITFGTLTLLGKVDIFCNGKAGIQPGCLLEGATTGTACSHIRAIVYYCNTLPNKTSTFNYTATGTNTIYAGREVFDPTGQGEYSLKTTTY